MKIAGSFRNLAYSKFTCVLTGNILDLVVVVRVCAAVKVIELYT